MQRSELQAARMHTFARTNEYTPARICAWLPAETKLLTAMKLLGMAIMNRGTKAWSSQLPDAGKPCKSDVSLRPKSARLMAVRCDRFPSMRRRVWTGESTTRTATSISATISDEVEAPPAGRGRNMR
jgi:hypothetical protein